MTKSANINKKRIEKFLSYYIPHRKIFALDLFFAVVSAAVMLTFPLVSGFITGTVLQSFDAAAKKTLVAAGLVLLLLVVVKVICNILYAYFGHAMGASMEGAMRKDLFAHFQKLPFGFHSKQSVGRLMTVVSNDLNGMTELFHHGPEDILMTVVKFVGAFVILCQINLPLTLIVYTVFPILCAVAVGNDRKMEAAMLRAREDLSGVNEQLEDALSGIRTVKAFGNERYMQRLFEKRNNQYVNSRRLFFKVEAFFYEIVEAYPQVLTMLVVFFGALFLGGGTLELPVLVMFLLYINCLYEPIQTMLNFMRLYEEGKAGFIRFMDLMEEEPSVAECRCPETLSHVKGEIRLEGVSFRYEDGTEDVLEQITLSVRPGENVALVGASGIGKSTLSMLIPRFYDVTAGAIRIDGVDVRKLSFASLRENIGIVQQEVFLFNGSIADNIRFGKPEASDEEIREAARLANASEFIERLDNGYDSQVGTHGVKLSGGQRQRLSLARVFLKDPKILILDEATSALDYESEVLVQKSLDKLMEGRTSIVIAHRLTTIRNADRIVVLGEKGILEEGAHEELLKKNGEYAKLCAMGGRLSR